MSTNLSVLVSSCDKYSDLLPYFTHQFDKYWACKNEYQKYIYTESVVLEHPDYIPILTNESNWTNSLLIALERIKTDYVFIILDDFFLIREFYSDSIKFALDLMIRGNYDKYIYHYPHSAFHNSLDPTELGKNVYRMKQNSEYTMTLQPSIWNVSFLKKCLKVGESPWQFEIDGTRRVNGSIEHKILMEIIPHGYHREAMQKGVYTQDYYIILQQENLI